MSKKLLHTVFNVKVPNRLEVALKLGNETVERKTLTDFYHFWVYMFQ